MGAIAGVIYPKLFPITGAVQTALETMTSRCNLEPHTHQYKNVQLGCRGECMGYNEQRTVALIYDGEFLGRDQMASELQGAGFQVDQLSDAELLVRAYEHWGLDFVKKLDGPFTIAIYDQHEGELYLARDRLGIKPLYWALYQGRFLFASELKGILATGMVPQAPARDAIGAYLHLGYIPVDLSPIEHVNKLLPGHILRLGTTGDLSVFCYWSLSETLKHEKKASLEELHDTLQRAVLKWRCADQEVGYLATGSSASAYVGHLLPGAQALTLEFSQQNQEEVQRAQGVAERLRQRISPYSLAPQDLLNHLVRVVWQLDEPSADPASVAIWHIARQTDSDIIFADVGADEVLADHPRFSHVHDLPSNPPITLRLWHRLVRALVPIVRMLKRRDALILLQQARYDPYLDYQLSDHALFNPRALPHISPQARRYFQPEVFLRRFYNLSGLGSSPLSCLYFDMKTALVDGLFHEYDRLTTPHNTKWASPFVDQDVVNCVASLPEEILLAPEASNRPLRQLLSQAMPDQTFAPSRPSSDFLVPWLHDAAIRRALDYLQSGTLVESGWLNRRWIKNALAGKTGASFGQLWSLLSLELWFRVFVNAPISTTPPDATLIEFLRG